MAGQPQYCVQELASFIGFMAEKLYSFGDAFGIKMNNEHLVTFLFGQIIIITNNYSVNASYKIFDLVKNIYTVG